MKKVLVLFILIFSQTSFASEDSFYRYFGGRQYYCEAVGNQNQCTHDSDCSSGYRCQEGQCSEDNRGSLSACVNLAYSGPFSTSQSQALCAGATSTIPAECGILAYSGPFSTSQSMELCTYARTLAPAQCANLAYTGPFSTSQSMELCANANSTSPAQCALDAYAGPYSVQQAIDLCK